MHAIDEFSLQAGGQGSRLLRAGVDAGTELPGCVLDAQYRHDGGYLFVTSWDCPFEETLNVIVTDPALRIVAQMAIGVPYATVWLEGHEATPEGRLLLRCADGDYRVTVAPRLLLEYRAEGEQAFHLRGGIAITLAGFWRRFVGRFR